MRTRHVVSLLALSAVLLLLALRNHLYNLFEISQTYGTFHSYLQQHQDVLFRFPAKGEAVDSGSESIAASKPVPKIIHQVYLSNGRPNAKLTKYGPAIESCQKLHPDWEFKMWEDEAGVAFMREHYPEILPHYVGYKQNIQRANILRYAVLHHFGGVYLDLDVTCLVPIDAPLPAGSSVKTLTELPWITPGAYPAGVNNAFILSQPKHAFLSELLSRVPSRDLSWPMPYVENMLSTGCMYFSNVWTAYTRKLASSANVPMEDRVYILADEAGNMDPHMLRGKITTPLFAHGGASSWHGWDAEAIVLIGKHYILFAMAVGMTIALSILACWKVFASSRPRRRRSWPVARLSVDRRSIEKDEEQALMKDG